jgi:hypothetical protein
MFLLSLIAALSGTPLRQAEEADDFTRSLRELGQGHVIETTDGGVGDDKEASILKADGHTHALAATILPAMADFYCAPPVSVLALPNLGDHRRADLAGSLPTSPDRKFAWLQCYRF